MIAMAHGLGYRVVAEGVETAAVRDYLVELGCDEIQGYGLCRPLAPAALDAWAAQQAAAGPAAA